jgi:hypothetical protein
MTLKAKQCDINIFLLCVKSDRMRYKKVEDRGGKLLNKQSMQIGVYSMC